MTALDNSKQVLQYRKFRILYHVILLPVFIIFTFLHNDIKIFNLGLNWYILILYFSGLLYIVFYRPAYFQLAVLDDNSIQIRYFNMLIFAARKKQIQFKAWQLKDFKITHHILGSKSLHLTIQTEKKLGLFPPISISLLTKDQINFLQSFFDKVKNQKA